MDATYAAHDSPSPCPHCLREINSCLNSPAVALVTEVVRCHTQYGDTREGRFIVHPMQDKKDGVWFQNAIQATTQFKMLSCFFSGMFHLIF